MGSEKLLGYLNDLLDDENRRRVKEILGNLDTASVRLASLEHRMDHAFNKMEQAAVTVRTAGKQVAAAGSRAEKTFARFDPVADELVKLSGRVQTLSESANALALSSRAATDGMIKSSLPRLNALLLEMQAASAQIHDLSGQLTNDPQMLLYGRQPPEPGPGESGYREPGR